MTHTKPTIVNGKWVNTPVEITKDSTGKTVETFHPFTVAENIGVSITAIAVVLMIIGALAS